jgi:hypothetical protein
VSTSNAQQQAGFYPPPQYPAQGTGTPLSNIPERAIHAPAFQPYQQAGFQPGAYYYPQMQPQPQYQPGPVIAPMVIQNGQQGSYLVPTIAPNPAGTQQPVQQPQGQLGVQQFEQNGMVFYYDPSQMYMQPAEGQAYNCAVPNMGGMITPAPDASGGYYYPMPNAPVYYPQQ